MSALTDAVASSRERGSKPWNGTLASKDRGSLPHGSVDRNIQVVLGGAQRLVASSRERGSKLRDDVSIPSLPNVASSRERGSKPPTGQLLRRIQRSLPHGSVDRNLALLDESRDDARRFLTGAWIETPYYRDQRSSRSVASSRERGSKRPGRDDGQRRRGVASSRERGSKHPAPAILLHLTGVASSRERGSKPAKKGRQRA